MRVLVFLNSGSETIPVPRHGLDERLSVVCLPERLSQDKNGLRQIRLLDKAPRPHQTHQLGFADDAVAALDESEKDVECLRRQRDGLIAPHQAAQRHVQAVGPEDENRSRHHGESKAAQRVGRLLRPI